MTVFLRPRQPLKPAPIRGASEYRCAACGQRIGLVRRASDVDDEAVVARYKSRDCWKCPECGGTSLERVSR